jgi:hypothetical protein
MTPGDKDSSRPKPRDPRADPRKAPGAEAADLVAEVLKDAKERDDAARRREVTTVGRTRQKVVAVSLPLAGAFSFYLWFGNPAWVTPTMPDPVTADAAEAGLRVAMFFEAQKIENFRRETGRLPDSLQEMGSSPSEMTYQRIDAQTYQLVGQSRGVTLTFNSGQAIQEFVGDAMNRLGIGQAL